MALSQNIEFENRVKLDHYIACLQHAYRTSSSALTRACVFEQLGSAMETTTVEICLTNRTALTVGFVVISSM